MEYVDEENEENSDLGDQGKDMTKMMKIVSTYMEMGGEEALEKATEKEAEGYGCINEVRRGRMPKGLPQNNDV